MKRKWNKLQTNSDCSIYINGCGHGYASLFRPNMRPFSAWEGTTAQNIGTHFKTTLNTHTQVKWAKALAPSNTQISNTASRCWRIWQLQTVPPDASSSPIECFKGAVPTPDIAFILSSNYLSIIHADKNRVWVSPKSTVASFIQISPHLHFCETTCGENRGFTW